MPDRFFIPEQLTIFVLYYHYGFNLHQRRELLFKLVEVLNVLQWFQIIAA